MNRERIGLWGLLAALAAIVLTRPWDGALFANFTEPGNWGSHLERVRAALRLSEGSLWRDWLVSMDRLYPPGLDVAGTAVGALVGWGAEGLLRAWSVWAALLVGASAAVAGSIDRKAALPAAVVTASLPAVHNSAFVYHHELLQFSLLWVAAAALALGQDRRPVIAGIVAGLAVAAATFVKWPAPAFAVIVLSGILFVRREGDWRWIHQRAAAWGIAVAVVLALVDWWLRQSTASLGQMVALSFGRTVELPADGLVPTVKAVVAAMQDAASERRPPAHWSTKAFLPFRLVVSTLSPLLAVGVLLGWGRWLWRDRRAWTVAVLPGLLFLPVVLAVLRMNDDRWWLAMTPVLALPVALAWTGLSARARGITAALWAAAALWVAWDVHHAEREHPQENAIWEAADLPDHFLWAGLGAASAGDTASGWVRRDHGESDERYLPQKEEAWAALVASDPDVILIDAPGAQPTGDLTWWDYRNHVDALRGGRLRRVGSLDGQHWSGPEVGGSAALLKVEGSKGPGRGWERAGLVVSPGSSWPDLAVWTGSVKAP